MRNLISSFDSPFIYTLLYSITISGFTQRAIIYLLFYYDNLDDVFKNLIPSCIEIISIYDKIDLFIYFYFSNHIEFSEYYKVYTITF